MYTSDGHTSHRAFNSTLLSNLSSSSSVHNPPKQQAPAQCVAHVVAKQLRRQNTAPGATKEEVTKKNVLRAKSGGEMVAFRRTGQTARRTVKPGTASTVGKSKPGKNAKVSSFIEAAKI